MDGYKRLNDIKINHFDSIFGCFSNLCSLSMSILFPECLFGRIYELAGFGECFFGCFKIFIIQLMINLSFTIFILNNTLNNIYDNNINNKISNCTINYDCQHYNYTKIFNNNCLIGDIKICSCLVDPLLEKCHYEKNISIYSYNSLIILSFIYFMIHIIINGCYYGHYRTKLSRKYNILHNSRYDMFVHALPCVHQLSLCQEYNTVSRLEIEPVYAVNFY